MRENESFAEGRDTEITLGVGHLLGMFLALVVLCALSMGTGYWMGRNSAKQATAEVVPTAPAPTPAYAANKPGAAQPLPPKNTAANPSDLTFFQAVQEKESHPRLAPEPSTSAAPAASATNAETPRNTLGNGYLVQIAAVRYQEDAKLLSETLRKQQYPVVVVTQPGDNLFHVQVGPYADLKQAEAIRARLVSAGYNPFLKR